jgi:hypothetical protein
MRLVALRCATALAVGVAVVIGTGTAMAAAPTKFPKFDEGKVTAALAAQGVTLCPDDKPSRGGGFTGEYESRRDTLYLASNWPNCPTANLNDVTADPREVDAHYSPEGSLLIDLYASQRTFDRGIKGWKALEKTFGGQAGTDLIGWTWRPVIFSLSGGASPDLTAKVVAAVKTLKPKPKVSFDHR